MNDALVRPGFGIGLALNDKDVATDQVIGLFQNRFGPATLDAELRAIGDQASLQACGQGVLFVGADLLMLYVDQLFSAIEFEEDRISRFLERSSVVKRPRPLSSRA